MDDHHLSLHHKIEKRKKKKKFKGKKKTRVVSHCGGVAIYILKYLKTKEELWNLKYFTMQKR
jgi:hypothetical protein